MLNQTKGGKRVYFSGLKVSRSQIISSPSGATGKLWIQESGISQFLQECKFPIMICQGQHCQSARHKHGDYLIMKAEWCCSSGCELPARGKCCDVRGWDAREGLVRVTSAPEQRAGVAAGSERASWHPQPARASPWEWEHWMKGCRKPLLLQGCTWKAVPLLPRVMCSGSAWRAKEEQSKSKGNWPFLDNTPWYPFMDFIHKNKPDWAI